MYRHPIRLGALVAVMMVSFWSNVARAVPPCRYTVQTIIGPDCGPNFGLSNVRVTGIDEHGRVACTVDCGGGSERAYTWTAKDGLVPVMGFPVGTYLSYSGGISEGWMCGSYEFSTPQESGHFGFLVSDTQFIVVPPPIQPAQVNLGSVNESGMAAGNSLGAMLFADGVVTHLFPGDPYSNLAIDLNANGDITGFFGYTVVSPPNHRAYLWSSGQLTDLGLGLPGAFATQGQAVNDRGHVCGLWLSGPNTPTGYLRRSFLWDGSQLHDLPTGPYVGAIVRDINNHSQIVGNLSVFPNSGGPPALWDDLQLYQIESMTGQLPFVIARCMAINNAGQIAAVGIDDGDDIGVVLTPVPPEVGDTNCDEVVNVDDLLGVINHWENDGGREDINDDGIVNIRDLIEVIVNWS